MNGRTLYEVHRETMRLLERAAPPTWEELTWMEQGRWDDMALDQTERDMEESR